MMQDVKAGSRRRGQQAQLIGEGLRIVDDEPLGDQQDGLWRVDRPEAREQVAQPGNRGVRLLERFPRNLARVVFDAGAAHRILVRARRHVRAFPRDRAVQHSQLATNDRQRLAQADVVGRRRARLLVAGHARDDLLGAIQIAEERQRRSAGAEADDGDAIGGQQLVDERLPGSSSSPVLPPKRKCQPDRRRSRSAGRRRCFRWRSNPRGRTRPQSAPSRSRRPAPIRRSARAVPAPSILTLKSPRPRPVIGWPLLSTTVTSTSDVTSTVV